MGNNKPRYEREQRTCPVCRESFTARKDSPQKACSTSCANKCRKIIEKRHTKRIDKLCEVCGNKFSVPYCFRNHRTCGGDCKIKIRHKIMAHRNCRHCGKEIIVRPSDPKVFCSRKCMGHGLSGRNSSLWVDAEIKVCKYCYKEFTAKGWKRENVFCNNNCMNAWRRENGWPKAVKQGTVRQNQRKNNRDYTLVKMGKKWRAEHRLIMERMIGRPLRNEERVHHKNGIKNDNRESNLRLCANASEHKKIHWEAEKIGLSVQAANDWIPTVEGMGC
jgi:hypothetical protein